MKIDLANIAGVPGARGRYRVSETLPPTEEFETVGPVVGQIEVENQGSLLLVRGTLRGLVRMTCVRCLGWCDCPISIAMEEEFATGETEPDISTMDRDEPETSAMSDFVLDVAELTRQQIIVNLPMAAVCRQDCRGICPRCGANLNAGPCACEQEPVDERWSKLGDLLGRPAGGPRGEED